MPVIVSYVHLGAFHYSGEYLIGYADNSTLIAAVLLSLTRDLSKVREWCDLIGMKLNERKTNTMVVSISSYLSNPHNPLVELR